MNSDTFTFSDIPDLKGKNIIVTGANSGLGFQATKLFAEHNASVTMACRLMEKAEKARTRIENDVEDADLGIMEIDLADLSSVQEFAEEYREEHDELHIMCNNAGLMSIPRMETEDGFEMQFGVNHLGHFALTANLLPLMKETRGEKRIVNQSSALHSRGSIKFDDLMKEEEYDKGKAYADSKLANLLFTYELERKLEENDLGIKAVGCHPGFSSTNLQNADENESSFITSIGERSRKLFSPSQPGWALYLWSTPPLLLILRVENTLDQESSGK